MSIICDWCRRAVSRTEWKHGAMVCGECRPLVPVRKQLCLYCNRIKDCTRTKKKGRICWSCLDNPTSGILPAALVKRDQREYVEGEVLNVDVERTCSSCGDLFWFTAQEQASYAQRRLFAPKRCPECREMRGERESQHESVEPSSTARDLVHSRSSVVRGLPPYVATPPVMSLPQFEVPALLVDRGAFFADIDRLLAEATSPIVERRRTFLEWMRSVDIRAEQIARKLQAAQTADDLVVQRTMLYEHLTQMITAASNAQLAAIDAHICVYRKQLEALKLYEEIQQRRALAGPTLSKQLLEANLEHQKLVRVEQQRSAVPVKKIDPRDQAIEDHRRDRAARARATRTVLDDFHHELRDILNMSVGIQRKASHIRALMEAYEFGDEVLSREALWVLEKAETLRG